MPSAPTRLPQQPHGNVRSLSARGAAISSVRHGQVRRPMALPVQCSLATPDRKVHRGAESRQLTAAAPCQHRKGPNRGRESAVPSKTSIKYVDTCFFMSPHRRDRAETRWEPASITAVCGSMDRSAWSPQDRTPPESNDPESTLLHELRRLCRLTVVPVNTIVRGVSDRLAAAHLLGCCDAVTIAGSVHMKVRTQA